MTPTVDLCNLALSLVGQSASISSVDPPEGSVYAHLCAQMYPLALGEMLEQHPWGFSTTTQELAPLATRPAGFISGFPLPSDCVRVWQVRSHEFGPLIPYEMRVGESGTMVCTGTETAIVLYTRAIDDPQLLPPAFKMALAHLLASMIAGPIIKGDTGAKAAAELRKVALSLSTQAATSDATQNLEVTRVTPVWIRERG